MSTFNDIVDPNGQTTDEDSYKALTALGILSAIQALVKATFNQTQVRGGGRGGGILSAIQALVKTAFSQTQVWGGRRRGKGAGGGGGREGGG